MSSHKNPKPATKESTPSKELPANSPMLFSKANYLLTGLSLLVIFIGFMLMTGSKGDIYDFRRITLAPIVVILGFVIGFFAIFWNNKKDKGTNQE